MESVTEQELLKTMKEKKKIVLNVKEMESLTVVIVRVVI